MVLGNMGGSRNKKDDRQKFLLLLAAGGTTLALAGLGLAAQDKKAISSGGSVILRSPSGENQTILPLTDNIPLIIKGFSGGVSDLLQVGNPGVVPHVGFRVDRFGSLLISPTNNSVPLVVRPFSNSTHIADFNSADLTAQIAFLSSGTLFFSGGSGNVNQILADGGSGQTAAIILINDNTGNSIFNVTPQGVVNIGNPTSTNDVVVLPIRAAQLQTSDIIDVYDNGGNLVIMVDKHGATTIHPRFSDVALTLETSGIADAFDVLNSSAAKQVIIDSNYFLRVLLRQRIGDVTTSPNLGLEINGGMGVKVKTVTGTYSATTTDSVVIADATTAAFTVTLPAANAAGSGIGQKLVVIKKDSSANAVTVSRAGADTIEGVTTKTLSSQYQKVTLISDNSSIWYDLGTGLQ